MTAFGKPSTNEVIDLLNQVQGAVSLAVASTNTVYGKSFALKKNKSYGLVIRFTGTTIDVKVELEEGNNELTDAQEGSAHTNWAVGTTLSAGIVSSAAKTLAVSPVVAKYGRLKLTGQGANHADVLMVLAELGESENL